MAQIVPRESIAGSLGQGLGAGLQKGLMNLADNRMKQMEQRNAYAQKLKGYQGLIKDPKVAEAFAQLPDKLAGPLLLKYFEKSAGDEQASDNGIGALQTQQSEDEQASDNGIGALQTQQSDQANPLQFPELGPRDLLNFLAEPTLSGLGLMGQKEQVSPQGQQKLLQSLQPLLQGQQKGAAPQLGATQPQAPAESAYSQGRRAQHASFQEVLARPSAKDTAKEQLEIRKETQPLVDKLTNEKDFADFSDSRINKMENLVKKGGLPIASFYSLFKNLEEKNHTIEGAGAGAALGGAIGSVPGAGIGAIVGGLGGSLLSPIAGILKYAQRQTSPNTEEFEKLSAEFIKGAKALFGNRITNDDLKAFFAQIPTLANTDHGKLQIIKNMRITNNIARIKYNEMKKILKENGGRRPLDLGFIIDERTKSAVDKLTAEFETV